MTTSTSASPARSRRAGRRWGPGVAVALTLGLAGCGSSGPARDSGAAVFRTHCETCHSISGTSAPRQQGGDLRNLHLPRIELLQLTAEMPPIHGPLTERQLRAVVDYVQAAERR